MDAMKRIHRALLLGLMLSIGTFAEAKNGTRAHRMLPSGLQNMCGTDYSQALTCGTPCPGGVNEECPAGEMCFAEIECPLPPTISPAPTRSPVKGFDIGKHDKEIIGYYASWQWYDRSKLAKPESMDFRKVTRVNFAFFQIDTAGNIWGTDDWADPRVLFGDVNLNAGTCGEGTPGCRCSWVKPEVKSCAYHIDGMGLISRVHGAGKQIWPSIGGWTLSDAFPAMAANPASRAKFAENCVGLIKDYDFDGIDIDWEYPGFAEHSGTPADTENYNLLLEELRSALDNLEQEAGQHYGITAALPCGPSHIDNIDVPTLSKHLSELNLMTYDFHGAWDYLTGVNSPLYDGSNDPEPGWSVDGCVKNWAERGAAIDKMNIGLAFYGRSFLNAKALGESHGGTDDISWAVDEGTPQYFNIMDQIKHMTSVRDDESKTQYAYFETGGMVSYDDERSICDKTTYAMDQKLNGFIIWELSGDVMDDLNTPLLDMVNRKLVETHIDCADPFKETDTEASTEALTAAAEAATTTAVPDTTETTTVTSEIASDDVVSITESTAEATIMAIEMTAETAEAFAVDTEITTKATEAIAIEEEEEAAAAAATTATKAPEATTTQATHETVDSMAATAQAAQETVGSTSAATAATTSNQQTSTSAERLPIKRRNKKPDSPYRPPKEEREL